MRSEAERHHAWRAAWAVTASALFLLGCAEEIHVRTAEAPEANFSSVTTYRLLTSANSASAVLSNASPERSANPILESSISVQDLRDDIQRDLDARGYRRAGGQADLSVAYYMGVHNRLEVTDYGYGYPFWGWGWRWGPGWGAWPQQQVTEYQQGTIIIDVLDASGRRLLWRGMAHLRVPTREQDYPRLIASGVDAIMNRFPGRARG